MDMKISKTVSIAAIIIAVLMLSVPIAAQAYRGLSARSPSGRLQCDEDAITCTEVLDSIGYNGAYTGHDEPSLLFYSTTAGSGNSYTSLLRLPTDPPKLPLQNGGGGTFNFQLHPAFWYGMAMCDDQSAPNPGGTPVAGVFTSGLSNVACTADSDSNIYTGTSPGTPSTYIGSHPGTAFMEMQFYAPGWVLWPPGNSCDATKWCAALNIDSLSENQNTGQLLNPTCQSIVGLEYVNFAFITTSGVAHAPASPVLATAATFTPNPATDFFMNSGDWLKLDMHDTSGGFEVVINDLTTGTSGSMKASAANDFGEVAFAPTGSSCTNIPTNFHPMYSTSSEDTRVVWAAHSYNIAFSDEIGHWEYCNGVNALTGVCNAMGVSDPAGLDGDDFACFNSANSVRVRVSGCFGTDIDFDGVGYQTTWPGTFSNAALDAQFHSTPILFTSFKAGGTTSYDRVAFETDLPRIEFGVSPPCIRSTGLNCTDPPIGANFYPIYSTHNGVSVPTVGTGCVWQFGGRFIPGTTSTFGGTSTTEYGSLLFLVYPGTSGTFTRTNDFRHILSSVPCTPP